MNSPMFGNKNGQCPRVDRFIVPRVTFTDQLRRIASRREGDPETVNIWDINYRKQMRFKNHMDEALGLKTKKPASILYEKAWPCTPRQEGCLFTATTILDLPAYSYATYPDVLDWSSRDVLVAALMTNYHMYNWKTQEAEGRGRTVYLIHCCTFDVTGDFLCIGTTMRTVELHDVERTEVVLSSVCMGCRREYCLCDTNAIDYSPTGNSFVTGCSRGHVNVFDGRTLECIHSIRMSCKSIKVVKISPNARFVAVLICKSPKVIILLWPSLDIYCATNSVLRMKNISWHPWRSALLGVAGMDPEGRLALGMWDVPSRRFSEFRFGGSTRHRLETMLFSHRTGELVLSLRNIDDDLHGSFIVVMSDPYTVVDQSNAEMNALSRVRTMVFSPDGTKLATATIDEDLIIWNFLPEDKKKKHVRTRRFCALPAYLDEVTYGTVIR